MPVASYLLRQMHADTFSVCWLMMQGKLHLLSLIHVRTVADCGRPPLRDVWHSHQRFWKTQPLVMTSHCQTTEPPMELKLESIEGVSKEA